MTSMTHITNFDYYEDASAGCSKYTGKLSYVYPKTASQYGLWGPCGVLTFDYLTPSQPQTGLHEYSLITTTYTDVASKDATGAVITTYSGKGELMDPHATNAVPYFQATIDDSFAYISKYNSGAQPSMVFSDNSNSIYGASATPVTYNGQADYSTASGNVYSKLNLHGSGLILNMLALPTAYMKPPAGDTNANMLLAMQNPNVTGAMLEGWIYDNQNLTGYTDNLGHAASAWVAQEDMQIATLNAGKVFNAYTNMQFSTLDPTSAAGLAARSYIYASTLLTYDPNRIIFGEWINNAQTPSGVHIVPEEGLVALYPVQTARQTVNELQVGTTGLYVREFQGCYYRGALVGPCATVANPTGASVIVNLPKYTHSLVLSGSGIFDGGTASFIGPRVTTLAPKTGTILFP